MAYVIIDGYNVIGIFHKDMEKARNDFIDLLVSYKKIKNHDITVVFDGYKSGDKKEKIIVTGGIRVIFSRLGEKADDVIKRIISEEKKDWIVVSSDKDIASFAWSFGSTPIFSETFLSRITRGFDRNKYNNEYEEMVMVKGGEDEDSHSLKGNPHKPSKKQRTIRRALSKL
jgi:predicted RNA-binding protein with PIN domain